RHARNFTEGRVGVKAPVCDEQHGKHADEECHDGKEYETEDIPAIPRRIRRRSGCELSGLAVNGLGVREVAGFGEVAMAWGVWRASPPRQANIGLVGGPGLLGLDPSTLLRASSRGRPSLHQRIGRLRRWR